MQMPPTTVVVVVVVCVACVCIIRMTVCTLAAPLQVDIYLLPSVDPPDGLDSWDPYSFMLEWVDVTLIPPPALAACGDIVLLHAPTSTYGACGNSTLYQWRVRRPGPGAAGRGHASVLDRHALSAVRIVTPLAA